MPRIFQSEMGAPRKKPWEKKLYGNEGYHDNYTDPLFLKDLQKNINVQIFKYPEAVLGATKLTHQLSLIIVFLLIYYNLHVQPPFVSSGQLLLGLSTVCFVGYILFITFGKTRLNRSGRRYIRMLRDDSKTVFSILVFGFILSPMLHTLTKTVSTDTIYTFTFFVFFLHVIFHDYGTPAAHVSPTISLNAALFGTICLASRLETSLDAFVLLMVAVTLFDLYPRALQSVEDYTFVRLVPVVLLSIVSCLCLLHISLILLFINIVMLGFCSFIYPFLFCYAQRYKNNLHGPWDEATVMVDVNANS